MANFVSDTMGTKTEIQSRNFLSSTLAVLLIRYFINRDTDWTTTRPQTKNPEGFSCRLEQNSHRGLLVFLCKRGKVEFPLAHSNRYSGDANIQLFRLECAK